MPILVALLLGLAALAFVLYPLYRRPTRVPGAGHPPGLSLSGVQGEKPPCRGLGCPQKLSFFFPHRLRQRAKKVSGREGEKMGDVDIDDREQTARTALQEIELDYQLGNLAETDYRTLRERYMRRALAAVKTRQKSEQELDEAIEEQLRFLREKEDNETESE